MNYRTDKYGEKISLLGFGCMRFTKKAGGIDIDKAEKEIMIAYRAGVNYYDTAYIYPGSEAAIGEIFERNGIRGDIKIATKLPHYLIKVSENMDKYFDEQLKRLRTDYVDYYLIHMLNDVRSWDRLKTLGIQEWLEAKKAAGIIKNIGFSYHGNSDMFCEIIDAYDWDFTQIQYNYLDENSQAGRTGLDHASAKGIPVVIMEPLRGGKLANGLPASALKKLKEYPVQMSPAAWAFNWLWDQPGVTCVLSGMNSVAMVEENTQRASQACVGMLSDEDRALLASVVDEINANMLVGCTGCRYCMPCPKNVDIPGAFAAYNLKASEGLFQALKSYAMCTALRKDYTGVRNCVGCGLCEKHCPQGIEIRKELKNVKKSLDGPIYQVFTRAAKLVMKY